MGVTMEHMNLHLVMVYGQNSKTHEEELHALLIGATLLREHADCGHGPSEQDLTIAFLAVFPDEDLVDQRSVIIQFDGDPAADDEKLSKLTEDERLRFTGLLTFLRFPFYGACEQWRVGTVQKPGALPSSRHVRSAGVCPSASSHTAHEGFPLQSLGYVVSYES